MEIEELNPDADSNKENGKSEIEVGMEVPESGMYFGSYEELFLFYKIYGKETGFGICKRSSRNDDNGEMKYVTLTCAREGKSRRTSMSSINTRPISKTDCKARLTASRDSDGRWKITSTILNHNHDMSPSKSRFFPCNRVLAPNVKRRLELNDQSGIGVSDTYHAMVVEAGGHENLPFQEIDCRNYVNQIRHLRLGKGDASAVHNYFLKMQSDNSDFFHLIDFDDDGRLRNLFWADARSRAACKEFGDVITFDTTYLTNKYDMPFAPFVGVNHHGQSVLLGCGLISKENIETFTWLFRAWLTCMHDCPPTAIITDQDKAMKAAIAIVFPNARHRWCLWHILKKLPEKFGAHKKYESIKYRMQQAIYDSLTPAEFEENWRKFIEKYELEKNPWLTELYEERHRWVPAYVKDVFWAGMSTTQRSESMNSYFDDYVDSKTTLKQFVEQYGNALRDMVEKENIEDSKSFSKMLSCVTPYEMERQFQSAYTLKKFKEFQTELIGKMYCELSQGMKGAEFLECEVSEDVTAGDSIQRVTYLVRLSDDAQHVDCNCKLFQFRGILCRHAITVLIHEKIYCVPEKYILTRWNKTIKRGHTKIKISYAIGSIKPETVRFDKMCEAFSEVANLATNSEDRCKTVLTWVSELKERLKTDASFSGEPVSSEKNDVPSFGGDTMDGIPTNVTDKILTPLVVRGKGRPPSKRKQSHAEVAQKKTAGRKKKTTQPKVFTAI